MILKNILLEIMESQELRDFMIWKPVLKIKTELKKKRLDLKEQITDSINSSPPMNQNLNLNGN